MSYLMSPSRECFLRCFILQYPVWAHVMKIYNFLACLGPQKHRQTLIVDHGLHRIDDKPILHLCNPILLQVVGPRLLCLDSCLIAEISELIRGVLIPVVCPQHLDLSSYHVLHLSFDLSEMIEDLILGLHEVDPCLPREVINEGHIIGCSFH
jgi:hypothetical protein